MTEDQIEKGARLLLEKYDAEDQMDISEEETHTYKLYRGEGDVIHEFDQKEYIRRTKLEEALTLSQILKNISDGYKAHVHNPSHKSIIKSSTLLEKVLDDLLEDVK